MCIQNNNTHSKEYIQKNTLNTHETLKCLTVEKELWKQDIGIFENNKNK